MLHSTGIRKCKIYTQILIMSSENGLLDPAFVISYVIQVEEVNSLVAELAKVTAKERALLQQCKDFLSMLAAKQVSMAIVMDLWDHPDSFTFFNF